MSIETVRKDYAKHALDEADCPENPIEFLDTWLQEALKETLDANAMVLSTVNQFGEPSSRVVLVRRIENEGLSFFTNYNSQKGKEMEENAIVSVNFFWPWLERQVRIVGVSEKLPAHQSDEYFNSRPRESQLGAWASQQSETLLKREILEENIEAYGKKFAGQDVPRPSHWGGYLIRPSKIEFWQGRSSRLHDRIVYRLDKNGAWTMSRLQP